MADKGKYDIYKLAIFFVLGLLGGLAGIFFGWLLAFFFGGSSDAEKYVQGFRTYKILGLGWNFVYFAIGESIGVTLAVMLWVKHILRR